MQIQTSSKTPNLLILISYKKDGNMKMNNKLRSDIQTLSNRNKFFKRQGIPKDRVVTADLVHGNNVQKITSEHAGKIIPKTDGLTTGEKGLYLSITVADCLPLFFLDPKKEVIGVVHAGWKGLDLKIIKQAIEMFEKTYDSKSSDLMVSIGPGIGTCHFEVKKDFLEKFKTYTNAHEKRGDKHFLDLKKIAVQQLIEAGVNKRNIKTSTECTYCDEEKYFSHRREKTTPVQAMLALIGIKN